MPIMDDAEFLLDQLEHKDRYLPTIEKMGEHRRCEWLSVRLLLKKMLGEEIEIAYLPSGKPYLTDSSYYISISHTKGYVAAIASQTRRVAIDIEQIATRVERVKERFMSEEEIANLSTTEPLIHLLLHWSAKESLFKLLDESKIEFKTQLHVRPFAPVLNKESSFEAYETRTERKGEFVINYIVIEQYVLTYVNTSLSTSSDFNSGK